MDIGPSESPILSDILFLSSTRDIFFFIIIVSLVITSTLTTLLSFFIHSLSLSLQHESFNYLILSFFNLFYLF